MTFFLNKKYTLSVIKKNERGENIEWIRLKRTHKNNKWNERKRMGEFQNLCRP